MFIARYIGQEADKVLLQFVFVAASAAAVIVVTSPHQLPLLASFY
jgi:hypothetical protein